MSAALRQASFDFALLRSGQALTMSPSPQPSPTRGEGVDRISSPLMGED